MNRRDSLCLTGGAAALMLASCTTQQIDDTEKKLADLIQQVQSGVANACAAAGKIVPTANTVLQVLLSIVGGTNALAATAQMVAQAVADIVAVGCPANKPVSPTASTAKGVPIVFY